MPEPIALYIHWPFCKSKCPYCDFNSHVRESVDQQAWREALLAELSAMAERTRGRQLVSIFFGGGTPSLMPPETVGSLIAAARGHWDAAPDLEITLEANPTSVEAGRFRAFREAGINRVSLGVQALEQEALSFLGRNHNAQEALAAVQLAAEIFPRYSFDLIYARPGQTLPQWREELSRALAHARGHLSLYQLTIEENTAFYHAEAKGAFRMPGDDLGGDMYALTQELMEEAGLPAYEVSNHARPGEESRHNLVYWRGGEYAGIGPGAHGRLRGEGGGWVATAMLKSPERWLEAVRRQGNGLETDQRVTPEERRDEWLMMRLRLAEPLGREEWERQAGTIWPESAFERLGDYGLADKNGEMFTINPRGMAILNNIIQSLC